MNGINWSALIAGGVTIGSAVSVAVGYPALGAVISNPQFATAATAVVSGVAGIWTMLSPALFHSTTTAAAAVIAAKQQ